MWLWAQRNSTVVWGCMTKMHTEGYSAWLWMQTHMREKREQAWQCDSAGTRLIIQKSLFFFRAVMSQIPPMDALFTRPRLSANANAYVCVCVCVCVCACDVYACLCQTGEAGRKRETTAGSEASLDSQLLMLQEPKKKKQKKNSETSLSLFTHPFQKSVFLLLLPSRSPRLLLQCEVQCLLDSRRFFVCVCVCVRVCFPLINTHWGVNAWMTVLVANREGPGCRTSLFCAWTKSSIWKNTVFTVCIRKPLWPLESYGTVVVTCTHTHTYANAHMLLFSLHAWLSH